MGCRIWLTDSRESYVGCRKEPAGTRSLHWFRKHQLSCDSECLMLHAKWRNGNRIRQFGEGREIIASVIEACDKEKKQNHLLVPLTKATERAAVYTGVGVTSIKTIRKENNIRNKGSADRRLISPGKKRTVSRRNAVKIDEFVMGVIRNAIFDFYDREKQVPTVSTMLPIIKEKINFPWGEKPLWRLMKKMGFRWKKCNSKRKVLIERADIVDWRSKYLVQMRNLREEGREIVYIDETWIDNSLVVKKCWQHDDIIGVTANISASVRLIVVHAGGNNGFINGAELIFKADSASGDYHGQMNPENFEKWVREKLLENLASNAVIVFDNAPYHSVVANKTPTAYSVKRDLIQWLNAKGLHVNENLRKPELYQLVLQLKSKNKIYKIDELFTSRGHSVIRLLRYKVDFQSMQCDELLDDVYDIDDY
ncbi:Uncharacterized protein GBIM_02761 [Gryllus bimaculatus]|nr:Uncharacterized protein GBIM_02761 [Gryllus bimaculatus]